MDKEQEQRLWELCGLTTKRIEVHNKQVGAEFVGADYLCEYWYDSQGILVSSQIPKITLDNLFKWAPDIIVGVTFRYFPGGCECELTYITEAGFETVKSWLKNETGNEKKSRELSAEALALAIMRCVDEN